MNIGSSYILTANAGSSSIKFCLFESGQSFGKVVAGEVSNIGQQGATLSVTDFGSSDHFTQDVQATDFSQAIDQLIEWTNQQLAGAPLAAIGHRIVHGGPTYYSPTLITDEVMHSLHALEPFDPDHMPLELLLVETLGRMYPGVRQVACFDTAFHHDLPTVSRLLPIPRSYEAKGIRRYGFHGLSYTYLMRALSEAAGDEAANGRVVLAHLGSGASLSAVHYGKSVDTTMGLTPDGGIPMSTRSGDLDPGVSVYLARSENMTPGQFSEVVSKRSGLLGISETTADMKQLLEVAEHDARAKDAVDIFCYNVRKTIGAYAAALGGIDTLVISGGMGEKAPKIRAQICANLDFLGLRLDDERNLRGDAVISADDSRVMVRVIPTDEASVVAEEVTRVLSQS